MCIYVYDGVVRLAVQQVGSNHKCVCMSTSTYIVSYYVICHNIQYIYIYVYVCIYIYIYIHMCTS